MLRGRWFTIPKSLSNNVGSKKSPQVAQWRTSMNDVLPSAAGFTDHDAEKKTFRLVAPENFNFAKDVIDKWARIEKRKKRTPALWWINDDGDELRWTFADISTKSRRVANVLVGSCGLRRGDRVLVMLPRIPQWWLINIACIRAGIVMIPCTMLLTSNDIEERVRRSGAKCVITDPTNSDKVEEIEESVPDFKKLLVANATTMKGGWLDFVGLYNDASNTFEDVTTKSSEPMLIFFTSGTTGNPKMTEISHACYGLGHSISGKYWMDLTENDIQWNLSDTGWAKSAWGSLFSPWYYGACVFIHDSPKFDAKRSLEILDKYPISTFCSAPTAYRMFIQERSRHLQLPHLRHCISGGEPLNPEVTYEWYDWTGRTIREGFGQTETVLLSASSRCIPNKPGSMGKPPPGMDTVIIDDSGTEVAPGVEGHIAVKVTPERPVGLFTCYVNEPERTKKAHLGNYYLTGDRGHFDEEGYLWFTSRNDDVITSAGYRIGPFEVESALLEHPAVAESAVVESPDSLRGAVVKAFVILTKPFKERDPKTLKLELQEHVKSATAPYKYPRKIEFVEDLPRTISGKIRRVELREREYHDPHRHPPDLV